MWRANGLVGWTVIAVCLIPPVTVLIAGLQLAQLRLAPGWAWTWEQPWPLPLVLLVLPCVATVLLIRGFPAFWRWNRAPSVVLTLILGGLIALGFLFAGANFELRQSWDRRVAHLDDAGAWERAAIVAHGSLEFDGGLWAVPRGGDRWECVSKPFDYPRCEWPFEVRKAKAAPRYLLVDSKGRVTALLDLGGESGEEWAIENELPPLDALRAEFGDGIGEIAAWE